MQHSRVHLFVSDFPDFLLDLYAPLCAPISIYLVKVVAFSAQSPIGDDVDLSPSSVQKMEKAVTDLVTNVDALQIFLCFDRYLLNGSGWFWMLRKDVTHLAVPF